MKIRKYEGVNEKDAMLKVKEELGKEALIVSVKNIKPRGFYKLFKKPYVEVTAALDDHSVLDDGDREPNFLRKRQTQNIQQPVEQARIWEEENDAKAYLEKFKSLIDKLPDENRRDKMETQEAEHHHEVVNASVIKVVYEQLIDHEVREEIVNQLTAGIQQPGSEDQEELTDVIAVVYKRIIKLLSDHATINQDKKNTVFFVGPTGVGKTTTIAKIASFFTLNMGKDVALITSDTYRIAAVEQLRTYANILNIPIKVVYTKEELTEAVKDFKDKDLVLIDTAGRSHKNVEHQDELKGLLNAVDEKEVYLVLSVATGYKDLMNITSVYDTMTDYKIIFTKLDETTCYGNVLNVKLATGAKLSYVTFGQNVPDDISDINPHEIARHVLGGNE